jgi:hypothetical protein
MSASSEDSHAQSARRRRERRQGWMLVTSLQQLGGDFFAAVASGADAADAAPVASQASRPWIRQREANRTGLSQFRQMTTPAAHRRRRPSAGRVSSQALASHPAQAAGAPSKRTVAFALSPLVSLAPSRQSRCQWGFRAQTVAQSLGRSPTEKELPRGISVRTGTANSRPFAASRYSKRGGCSLLRRGAANGKRTPK